MRINKLIIITLECMMALPKDGDEVLSSAEARVTNLNNVHFVAKATNGQKNCSAEENRDEGGGRILNEFSFKRLEWNQHDVHANKLFKRKHQYSTLQSIFFHEN